MKTVVDTKSFIDAVTWITKSVDNKDEKAYVALHIDENGTGFLSNTNGSSHMKSPIEILSVDFEGDDATSATLALEARYIQRLASSLGGHLVPLEITKVLDDPKTSLTIKRASEKFTVPILDVRVGRTPEYISLGEVSDVEFFDTLKRLAKLTDAVNAGIVPVIGTVDVKLDKETSSITLMATDRYALGEVVVDFTPLDSGDEFYESEKHLLLPHDRAVLISPSKGEIENISLIYEKKSEKFGYEFPDGRVALFSLSTAEPLVYEGIKKGALNTTSSVLLNVQDVKNAIGVISNLAYDESVIYFSINKNGLTITDSKKSNTLKVNIEEHDGLEDDDFTVQFTRSVINEIFSPIATNRFNLKWSDNAKPFILQPVFDDDTVADNVFALAIPDRS